MLASDQVIKFPYAIPLQEVARPCVATFFRDAHWGQCLELVSHLCQHSDKVLVVIGPSGIGKTSMKYALENRQYDNLHLVDDAHNLSLDQIERLLHEREQHVILFARPDLVTRIGRTGVQADFSQRARVIEIDPLTFDEMVQFLRHQWQNIESAGHFACSDIDLRKIFAQSQGIPGAAKQLFIDSMRGHEVLEEDEGTKRSFSPFMVGLIAAVAIAVCLLALMWPSTGTKMSKETLSMPQTTPPSTLVSQVPATNEFHEAELEFDRTYEPQREIQERKLAELEEKMLSLQSKIANVEEPAKPAEIKTQAEVSAEPVPAKTKKVAKPKVIEPTTKPKNSAKANIQQDEKKILATDKKHYALQLVASSNEKKIKDFITKNKLEDKAKYYVGSRDGKPWYTVIYGDYSDKQAALASVNKLPAEVKKLGPWARQYSSIQEIITNKPHE